MEILPCRGCGCPGFLIEETMKCSNGVFTYYRVSCDDGDPDHLDKRPCGMSTGSGWLTEEKCIESWNKVMENK